MTPSSAKRWRASSRRGTKGQSGSRTRAEHERAELLRGAQEAHAEVDTANRLRDEFLAMVSHELRTPLNAVLGWARMITSHQLEGPRVEHALGAIERNAAALAIIIDDLLDVSRIVAGKLNLASEPVDLTAVTRAAVDEVRPLASQKRIDVQFGADLTETDSVSGDAGRLQQVIGNLLTNAIKFTPEGGRVDVSLARVGADVEVTVADSGDGIEPAFLPHVWRAMPHEASINTAALFDIDCRPGLSGAHECNPA